MDGNKDREFGRFLDLPRRTRHPLTLAINGPETLLREHGWATIDAMSVSRSLWDYRDFIQGSKGEFGVAKHAYVSRRSGWFSDRDDAIWLPDVPLWFRTPDGARMCRRAPVSCPFRRQRRRWMRLTPSIAIIHDTRDGL